MASLLIFFTWITQTDNYLFHKQYEKTNQVSENRYFYSINSWNVCEPLFLSVILQNMNLIPCQGYANHKPIFSIVIPTLNEEKYLPQLLGCLKAQTFSDFEIIHVDAQSQDKTREIAKDYSKHLSLKTYISKKKNVSFQRNLGAKQAKADWIIFMDADNILPNDFLLELKHQVEKNPKMDGFTCWLDVSSYPTRHKPTAQIINFGLSTLNNTALGALIGAKKVIFQTVSFNEKIKYIEDGEFVKDLEEAGFVFKCLREPRYTYNMRRLEKEGTLKISRTFLESRLYLLIKGDMENFNKYPMLGGDFYEKHQPNKFAHFIKKADFFLKQAPARQLKKAKKIWSLIDED